MKNRLRSFFCFSHKWLEMAAQNKEVTLYRCEKCGGEKHLTSSQLYILLPEQFRGENF